jgi:hypothetical protein
MLRLGYVGVGIHLLTFWEVAYNEVLCRAREMSDEYTVIP